jgi:hypothetical protein
MVEGDSNKVMAKRLGVSIRTIEVRRANVFRVFRKVGTDSVAELVRFYLEAATARRLVRSLTAFGEWDITTTSSRQRTYREVDRLIGRTIKNGQ